MDWWFVFKFNAAQFAGCGGGAQRACTFGGNVQQYPAFGQQFAVASSDAAELKMSTGCAGDTTADPLGATFGQVYTGAFHYLIWNDQFLQRSGNPRLRQQLRRAEDKQPVPASTSFAKYVVGIPA